MFERTSDYSLKHFQRAESVSTCLRVTVLSVFIFFLLMITYLVFPKLINVWWLKVYGLNYVGNNKVGFIVTRT